MMLNPTTLCVLLSSVVVLASPTMPPQDSLESLSLPRLGLGYTNRVASIADKRKGWKYGEYPLGGAFYPTGTLANKTISEQQAQWFPIVVEHAVLIEQESAAALDGIIAAGNFSTLDDYTKTYENQWNMSLPRGPMQGMLTNYTDDRLFSMMRLSATPYKIKRVQRNEPLLFLVHNAASITGGLSLKDLRAQGRLFSTDFSKDLPSSGKYGAGCQAYFYIDNAGDFLPLAVKPIVKGRESSALVYTPQDKPSDWLLAKMLLNQNDGYHSTWAHVGQSHSAAEAPYLAAIRTLSEDHPVMAMLHRLEKTPWGVRPNLVNGLKNGPTFTGPQYYPWSPDAATQYVNELYASGESADFARNYYREEFRARGLVDSGFGPALKSFPFYEDAGVVTEAIRDFMDAFVGSYYRSDAAVRADPELRAWLHEARGAAEVHDFPRVDASRRALADALTHQAYLSVIVSNVMSTNGIHLNSMSLPFAPAGFERPIPSTKCLTEEELMSFMPTPEGAVWQVSTYVVGHRPMWRDTKETLSHLFDDGALLARTNPVTRAAAIRFEAAMMDFSVEVRARAFDENGLSRGMPFIWDALDPNYAPYWGVI